MKLIEALKDLPLTLKKIDKNIEEIAKYSSTISDDFAFETEAAQRQEVESRIQANRDLVKHYLDLNNRIGRTNAQTKVSTSMGEYTIAELLTLRGAGRNFSLGNQMRKTFGSLSDTSGMRGLHNLREINAENPQRLVRMYNEKDKNEQITKWDEFLDSIDGKLEVVNAQTDLVN